MGRGASAAALAIRSKVGFVNRSPMSNKTSSRSTSATGNRTLILPIRYSWSHRREHRHLLPTLAGLEHETHRLADLDRIEVAIDDVGHDTRPFGEFDIGNRVGHRRAAHHAVGVDRPPARGFLPL